MPYFGATTLASVLKELDGRKSLPESGKELVSTIIANKGTVRDVDVPSVGGRSNSAAGRPATESAAQPSSALAGAESRANLEQLQRFSYVEAALWITSRLADGLAHAHERGIVHRDLKPANILLTDDGHPILLDFNLAQDTKLGHHPATAQAGGTLPFMPPEQIEAFRTETVLLDFRSDIYSLGVILFKMLTGHQPFPAQVGPVKEVL